MAEPVDRDVVSNRRKKLGPRIPHSQDHLESGLILENPRNMSRPSDFKEIMSSCYDKHGPVANEAWVRTAEASGRRHRGPRTAAEISRCGRLARPTGIARSVAYFNFRNHLAETYSVTGRLAEAVAPPGRDGQDGHGEAGPRRSSTDRLPHWPCRTVPSGAADGRGDRGDGGVAQDAHGQARARSVKPRVHSGPVNPEQPRRCVFSSRPGEGCHST